MAKLNDLTGNKVQERKRQVRTYGTKTDLASTVVERGSTHWAEGSNVHIDGLLGVAGTATVSGTLRVTGLLDVTGTFNGSGVNNLDGTNNLSGDNNLTGPTTIDGVLTINGDTSITGLLTITGDTTITGLLAVDGPTTISGTLDIEGATTVASDFEIISGGLFKSGVTTIEPTGKATFGDVIIDPGSIYLMQTPGGWLSGTGADDITLASSLSSSVSLNSTRAALDYLGSSTVTARAGAIDLTAPQVHVSEYLNVKGRLVTRERVVLLGTPTASASVVANVHMDSDGYLWKVA